MAQFQNMFRVDLNKGPAVVSLARMHLANIEANRIGAIVTKDLAPVTLTGTCVGTVILADNTTVSIANGTISGNEAYVDLPSSCYTVEGPIHVFVTLVSTSETVTLVAGSGYVNKTQTDAVIDPGMIIPSVEALIEAINDAVADIPSDYSDLMASIAPFYADLTFPVKKGAFCWYNGDLKRAKVAIPASEEWTAAHWEDGVIADGLPVDETLTIAGAAADAKTAGDLIRSKAPAILSSVTGYDHEDVDVITFNGNTHAWGNARYADKTNLLRLTEKSGTAGGGGVTYHSYDNIIEFNGTASSGGDTNAWTFTGLNIPAGTYTFKIEPHDSGSSTISGTKNMYLDFYYEGASSYSVRGKLSVGTSAVSTNMTATEKIVKMVVWFGTKKDNVYDDYRLFYSLFPSNVTITDTQETVSATGTLEYELPSTMAEVDTLMHTSTVQGVVDTKTYVDTHTPDVNFVYIKPEDYGAYGDGTHDDSVALQACLTAAKKNNSNDNNFVVRGYGRYKISTGLVIHGRELNIYIKSIVYTGNDTAVSISTNFSKIEFGSIRATAGGSSAKGIALVMQATAGMENGFNHSELICRYLFTNGRNLEYVDLGNGANVAYYNVFRFTYQRSANSDLMYVPLGANVNEWDIYGKTCICPNGYAFIYNDQYGATIRMHEYCFENTTKNGIYGKVTLLDCRFAEMMNLKSTTALDQGNVFVFDGVSAGGFVRCEHPVDLVAIDVSNAWTFQDALDAVKAQFDDNPSVSNWEPWFQEFNVSNGRQFLEIQKCVRSANAHMTVSGNQVCIPEGKIIGYFDKIAYVPYSPIYKVIDDDFTVELTSTNDYDYITPTTFDIDAASVDITLDSSYCCLGIKEFDVIQHTGKTAVVYDKNNNKIFDGTSLGAGVFHFKCTMVPLTSLSITTTQGVVKNCPAAFLPSIYTGSNERWSVTKEELITV